VQTGSGLYLAAGVVCVVLQARGQLSTSTLGLVLLYAGSLQRAMMDLLMRLTQIEVGFVSLTPTATPSLPGTPLLTRAKP
jgi:hypothetical protein